MKENNIFKTNINDNLDSTQNKNESEILDLTKGNTTFFHLITNNDSGNKEDCEKIDNAKKTLDSIYHVYEQVNELEKNNKLKLNLGNNEIVDETGRIVMPGTDYHGDRRSFQAGVISELVTWKKDIISVMDVTDGEILFTGTVDEIKANISEIKNKLNEKNMDHQAKIKDKIKQIITQGMTAYLQEKLLCDSCNCEVIENKTFKITITESDNEKIFEDQNTHSITIEFDIDAVIDILVDIATDDQQKSGKFIVYFNQLKSYNALTDESQIKMTSFFKQFFSLSKQQKIALVHDFEFNGNFDPEKQSVVLLGDYIDRGDGSCEILCMISNIQKRISESNDERFKNNKDCFVVIGGNHESGYLSEKDETNSVCNRENSCYANDLAKKMMADGQLVSGHVIASKTDDAFFSFSHTYIIKTDCYLIMRQIFRLEDLLQNINNENWLNDGNNENEFVKLIQSICILLSDVEINNYGKKILQLLAKRYKTVKDSNKYFDVLKKVNDNFSFIQEKLEKYKDTIFGKKTVLESGNQFYDDLKTIFSDRDFFELRYLAMDTLVYPIAASADEKLDLCLDSIYDGDISLTSVLSDVRCAFSDFFSHGGSTPRCLKSVLSIIDKKYTDCSPNCLNWQRFFHIPENVIIPNSKQVVGHDPIFEEEHMFAIFYSQIIEIDILQSVGYNFENMVSHINKTFINTGNITASCTFTYKAEHINCIKPKVSEYNRYFDIFHNKNLDYEYVSKHKNEQDASEYNHKGINNQGKLLESDSKISKSNCKASSKKWVLIILELLLICIGLLLTLLTSMQVLGVILLIVGAIGFFVSTFFHDKVANWICNLCFGCCGISIGRSYKNELLQEKQNSGLEQSNKFPPTPKYPGQKQNL